MDPSANSAVTPLSEARAAPRGPQAVSLIACIALAFLVSWTLWSAAAVILNGASSGIGARALLFLPGTFAPPMVALGLTVRAEGPRGIRAVLSRLFLWHVRARWCLFGVGYMAAVKLTAALSRR